MSDTIDVTITLTLGDVSQGNYFPGHKLWLDVTVLVQSWGYPPSRSGHPDNWYPGEGPDFVVGKVECEGVELSDFVVRLIGLDAIREAVEMTGLEPPDDDFYEPDYDDYDQDYESDRAADRYADALFNRY